VPVLYLDTNHLSHLARFPREPGCRSVRELLDSEQVQLGLSLLHLQELSAPAFRSRGEVGALLDDVPVTWAPSPDELFDREVRSAIRLAMTGNAESDCVFDPDFVRTFGAPFEANIAISEMLEAMAGHATLRDHLREAAAYGAAAGHIVGRAAAVVRNPSEPILARIRDLNSKMTPAGLHLPRRLSPEEIFDGAGGLSGFPAINVAHSLARTRLKDESFRASENDIFDEWHACYAPYSTVIALDRSTAARFRMTHLPEAARVTHRLADISALLATG
jgi:hypothetical protein